ncbi:hypothetical protein [Nannocystis punicea]|uniref:Uncharacterized protein n=1 Tax=Nannocystis punicea TaxID=2995304 RepID=A0ABY7GWC8_9BACT|nr:hypothetical protein [Nannocystis poenicansa]WAS91263.1 hypothetical protein O0S08_34180 [Nannocystis poenicansa]
MRFLSLVLPALTMVLAFGALGPTEGSASAAICCGATVCQSLDPPPICETCTPTCTDDEPMPVASEMVYDAVEGICYESIDSGPTPCDSAEGAQSDESAE